MYRSDGSWTPGTVVDYDASGDTYDIEVEGGQVKYMVEPDYLRHAQLGCSFVRHQAATAGGKVPASERQGSATALPPGRSRLSVALHTPEGPPTGLASFRGRWDDRETGPASLISRAVPPPGGAGA